MSDPSTGHDTGEGVVSGVVPNRNNEDHPDIEQEKRAQARQASAFARGEADELPSFATKGPDAQLRDGDLDTSKFSQHEKPAQTSAPVDEADESDEKPAPKKRASTRRATTKEKDSDKE